MDWFKRLVSKETTKEEQSSSSSPSSSSPAKPVYQPPTKEELKRRADEAKAKEKELFVALNAAWKQHEDCKLKDKPAKYAVLMNTFLTLYDVHKISFKTIKSNFPGLMNGFHSAACNYLTEGFRNIMTNGTPSHSPKKRRPGAPSSSNTNDELHGVDKSRMSSKRLYDFLANEAADTVRVLLILAQELTDIQSLTNAGLPTVLVNIYQTFWQLPPNTILNEFDTGKSSTSNATTIPITNPPEIRLITLLLQLCSYKSSIQELIRTDTLSRLFTMPLAYSDVNQSLRDRILPVTTTIIKCNIDKEVIDYLDRKDCLSIIIETMANNFEYYTPANILDCCTMILTLLEESVKIESKLLDEFNNSMGYNLLTKALIVLEDKAPNSNDHTQLVEYINDFVFVGGSPLFPEPDADNKYNLPDDIKELVLSQKQLEIGGINSGNNKDNGSGNNNGSFTGANSPNKGLYDGFSEDGSKLRRARNAEAFQVMQNYFFGSKSDKTKELILDCMARLFNAHPLNFYALQHLRTIAHFVEAIPQESPVVRDGIHQLLVFCTTVINVIPFYALCSLWTVFGEAVPSARLDVIEGCFNTMQVLMNFDNKFKTILRDAGVMDGLIALLQRYHKTVAKMLVSSSVLASKAQISSMTGGGTSKRIKRPPAASDSSALRSSGAPNSRGYASGNIYGSYSLTKRYGPKGVLQRLKMERLREQQRVCEELLADKSVSPLDINAAYPAVTDLLSLMVTGCPENVQDLKAANGSLALHNLMQQTETRNGALAILVQLIRFDTNQTDGDLGNLLITLQTHSDIELRRDIMISLLDLFAETPATKRSFREYGGFAAVLTTVILLKNKLDSNVKAGDPQSYSYSLDTLKLTLAVINAAVSSNRINRLHMAAHGGWPLLEVAMKDTGLWNSDPELYIDWMFLLATEDLKYVQTIPSSASTFAKSKLAKDAATLLSDNGTEFEAQKQAQQKRLGRYREAVEKYVSYFSHHHYGSNATEESGDKNRSFSSIHSNPLRLLQKDLLSILLSTEDTDDPILLAMNWKSILPIHDHVPVVFNPGPLSGLLEILPTIQFKSQQSRYSPHQSQAHVSTANVPASSLSNSTSSLPECSTSSSSSILSTPIDPQQVKCHLHILLRFADYARASPANLEAFSSLGLAGKAIRIWSCHLRSIDSILHVPTLYLLELLMAYRPDTLEVNQYLRLFDPSFTLIPALQALLSSFLRTTRTASVRMAPFFLFDMSRQGYGSMTTKIPDVQWPFHDGYTVSMWCYFERLGPEDMELFRIAPSTASSFHPVFIRPEDSAADAHRSNPSNCIVSAVLRTGQLLLRNFGADDCLTVETFNFTTGRWYHIAVVHERYRFSFAFNAETKIYVDGSLRSTVKANMGQPTQTHLSVTFGTPEEIHSARNTHFAPCPTSWRLGPFYLIDQSLNGIDVLTLFNLGPSYHGSFQGLIGEYLQPEVVTSQLLLALEEIKGSPQGDFELLNSSFSSPIAIERVILAVNAAKHVLQMHPSSRNLPNFAFLRDPSGRRAPTPLFATTSNAIRGTSSVASPNASSISNNNAPNNNTSSSSNNNSLSNSNNQNQTSNNQNKSNDPSMIGTSPPRNSSIRNSNNMNSLSEEANEDDDGYPREQDEYDANEDESITPFSGPNAGNIPSASPNSFANAAGVLAGLAPQSDGGTTAGGRIFPPESNKASLPQISLVFEQGDSPIACWPQPLQNVLYRTNGMDMLLYLFEFVATCEASTVGHQHASMSVAGFSSALSHSHQNIPNIAISDHSNISDDPSRGSTHGSKNSSRRASVVLAPNVDPNAVSHITPPSTPSNSASTAKSIQASPVGLPHVGDTSMALLVLKCIRSVLRSNPQAYLDILEKNSYSVISTVLKRFPAQLTHEKFSILFDIVGVTPNTITHHHPDLSSIEGHNANTGSQLANFDPILMTNLPRSLAMSLWSLASRPPMTSFSTGVLSNVTAFRTFVLDYRMWRKAPLKLQESILDYVDHLIQGNLVYHFNVSRMRKYHLLPCILNILREESLDMSLLHRVVGLLSDLLVTNHNDSDLSLVAGFLIHSFHLQTNPPNTQQPQHTQSSNTKETSTQQNQNEARFEALQERFDILRNMVISVVFYLVADAEGKGYYEKVFDPDWINLFVSMETNPDTITTAVKIMAQLALGNSYSIAIEKKNALKNLSFTLPQFHSHVPLYFVMFSMMLGKPPTDLPDSLAQLDFSSLMEIFKLPNVEDEYHIECRGALDVILAMVKAGCENFILLNDGAFPQSSSPRPGIVVGGGSTSPSSTTANTISGSTGVKSSASSPSINSSASSSLTELSAHEESLEHSEDEESGSSLSQAHGGTSTSHHESSTIHSPKPKLPSNEAIRKRASSTLPRSTTRSAAGGGSGSDLTVTMTDESSAHPIDDSELSSLDDAGRMTSKPSPRNTAASILSGQGMGTAIMKAFKTIKTSKRKSTTINNFVPQQVAGGTLSGASSIARVFPKFQDKFHLYTPPQLYQEQSHLLEANINTHKMLFQFFKHLFLRSSSFQDAFKKGDLAHQFVLILWPHGKLNLPATGSQSWSPSITSSLSGADQWSLLLMEFICAVLIQMYVLNPQAPKDTSILSEVFEVAVPVFATDAERVCFSSIFIHYMMDQIRPKLKHTLTSSSSNQIHKVLAPVSRFCSFVVDRICCRNLSYDMPPLILSFITDIIIMVSNKMDEDSRSGAISSKDANSIKSELSQFSRSLNRLVLWMIRDSIDGSGHAGGSNYLSSSSSSSSTGDPRKSHSTALNPKFEVLGHIIAHHKHIFSQSNNDKEFFSALCKMLHPLLIDVDPEVKARTMIMWKLILHAKLDLIEWGFTYKNQKGETIDIGQNNGGFMLLIKNQVATSNNEQFNKWLRDNASQVASCIDETFGKVSKTYWTNESKYNEEKINQTRKNMKMRTMKSQKTNEAEKMAVDLIRKDIDMSLSRTIQEESGRYNHYRQANVEIERYLNRKWTQRRITLFHDLHIWSAAEFDPETESPISPGLAPFPHKLHKWKLDMTEGLLRMRSKMRRNYDFYQHYPFQASSLRATPDGPLIYPTTTPQSTSSKSFDELSEDERILVDRNFYINRSIRRHQAMAAEQLRIGRELIGDSHHRHHHHLQPGNIHSLDTEDDEIDDEFGPHHSEGSDDDRSEGSCNGSDGSELEDDNISDPDDEIDIQESDIAMISKKPRKSSLKDSDVEDDDTNEGDDRKPSSLSSNQVDREQAAFDNLINFGKKLNPKIIPQQPSTYSDVTDDDEDLSVSSNSTAPKVKKPSSSTVAKKSDKSSSKIKSNTMTDSSSSVASRTKVVGASTSHMIAGDTTTEYSDDENSSVIGEEDDLSHSSMKHPQHQQSNETSAISDFTAQQDLDATIDDGDQKLKRLLQPGEEPTDMFNCSRVVGLDVLAGIFVICHWNAYFIQDYHITRDGDLIEIPKASMNHPELNINASTTEGNIATNNHHYNNILTFISSSSEANEMHRKVIRWAHEDVEQILNRRYLLRPVAVEIFSVDGRNSLLVFELKERDRVIQAMMVKRQAVANRIANQTGTQPQVKELKMSLRDSTEAWSNGLISNFDYLMRLNTLAGRSYNDLTQYPVFPWIIADYNSKSLDLGDAKTFRDLTKPMGALGSERRDKLMERFEMLDDAVPKFHYGSHYSSAAIVLYYLIRLEPMTQQFLTLQGGRFDRPDRLFESVAESWVAASAENPMDVKEVIPEFYYLPEAFINNNNFIFGRKQAGDESIIDDVVLPPWANGDPNTFVKINRQALESPYVSANLHHWIDLIFGYKQKGQAAEQAMNLFYYLTYEGAVDIDKISDPIERQGIIDQINNFGQTPTQLFKKPHPKRQNMPKYSPSLFGISSPQSKLFFESPSTQADKPSSTASDSTSGNDSQKDQDGESSKEHEFSDVASSSPNNQSNSDNNNHTSDYNAKTIIQATILSNKGIGNSVIGQICCNNTDKVVPLEVMKIGVPGHMSKKIAWGYDDGCLRFFDGDKCQHVVPNTFHRSGIISCMSITPDAKCVITGGTDSVICVFRLDWETKKVHFNLASTGSVTSKLLGHCAPISHVAVSRSYSMIISSDTMGQVLIWDLNTFQFVRALCGPSINPSFMTNAQNSNKSTFGGGMVQSPSMKKVNMYHEHQYSVDGDIRAAMAEASVEEQLGKKSSPNQIDLIKIDETNGNIYVSLQGSLYIWTCNGNLLAGEEISPTHIISSFTITQCPAWMDGVNFIIIGLKDGTIRIYRIDTTSAQIENVQMIEGKWPILPPRKIILQTILPDKHKAPVTALSISPNQKRLYSGDASGVLIRWEEVKLNEI